MGSNQGRLTVSTSASKHMCAHTPTKHITQIHTHTHILNKRAVLCSTGWMKGRKFPGKQAVQAALSACPLGPSVPTVRGACWATAHWMTPHLQHPGRALTNSSNCSMQAYQLLMNRLIDVRGQTPTQSEIRVEAQSMAGSGAVYQAKVKAAICAWVREL